MVIRIIRIARFLIILASRQRSLVFENLPLRQQLAIYRRTRPKPALRLSDPLFWVGLLLAWPDWIVGLGHRQTPHGLAWHCRACHGGAATQAARYSR